MILRGFLRKEITQMLRNPVMVFALLFMPIVQAFLFSYAVTNEPKNITIEIEARPNDYLMNRIYEHALASGWFVKAKAAGKNPFEAIQSDKSDVVLVAPKGGLTRNIHRGNDSDLQVLINASNVLKAQSVSGYIKSIVSGVLREDLSKSTIIQNSNVNFQTRILFNPEMDTKMFIVPSVMVMIVASSILSLICIAVAKEKEMGTMETLISAPISKKDLILGKTLPCMAIGIFNMVTICLLGLFVFGVPFRGNVMMFLLSFCSFSFAMSALGILMSTFCRDQQQALLAIMMAMFLLMMLSGAMFPVETMPNILKFIANINPLTHFIYISRNIMLKGCNTAYFIQHNWPMLAFGCITAALGVKRFRQTL